MKWLLAGFVVLAIMLAVVAVVLRLKKGASDGTGPYFAKKPLTPPEQVLYFRLLNALPDHMVLAQVQLSRLLGVKKGNDYRSWLNRINQMSTAPSAFGRLYQAVGDSDSLEAAYDKVLKNLFESPFWESGTVELRRILWGQGQEARTQDAFGSPGLYLWGIETRPLYIGITRGSFRKRFSRYIWHERSQCHLAQQFEASLVSDGIDGFPAEVREWYARQFRGSEVRLRGAVRFAKEGIAGVWFALFPHNSPAEIEDLERALVPVAEAWNHRQSLRPLLNVEFNRRENKRTSSDEP
jgi:hypothetical protein